jgi:hypothetical protein
MPRLAIVLAAVAVLLGSLAPASAGIVVTVDQSEQRLSVMVDGVQRYQWPVSTARIGYRTPNGTYKPEWLARKHFSRQYDWSPMPYSIFFNEGYAIHGSYEVSRLGSPASHGCIRLSPKNAELLFELVKGHTDETTIVISGERPKQTAHSRDTHEARRSHRSRQPTAPQTFGAQQDWHGAPNFFFPTASAGRR